MKPTREPGRWGEGQHLGSLAEQRAEQAVRAVGEPAPLGEQALSRIAERVRQHRPALGAKSARRPGFRPVFAFAMLLASATTVAGVRVLWRPHVQHLLAPAPVAPPIVEESAPIARPHASSAAPPPDVRAAVEAPSTLPVDPVPYVEPSPRTEIADPIPPGPRVESSSPRSKALPPAPVLPAETLASPAATSAPRETEGRMLAAAVAKLRRARDARGALALLDRYSQVFPNGLLAPEARRARFEALLDLGDHPTALALLDGDGAPTLDLLLLRAELRAEVARYADAAQDFTVVMGGARDDALERALFGRAVCFRKRGQEAEARADLLAYQRRFPGGKKAAEVARLLSGRLPANSP